MRGYSGESIFVISSKGLKVKIFVKKLGMTHIYTQNAKHVPVTVLEIEKTFLAGKRTVEKDGYSANIFVKTGNKKSKKSVGMQFKDLEGVSKISEQRVEKDELETGALIGAGDINVGDMFKVVATSKGKGFAGTVKRHGFATGPKTHGSDNYRRPGSIGPTYPQRVIKGRRMAGKMGSERITVKDVEVVKVIEDEGRIFVKGPIPGPNSNTLILEK